MLFTSFVFFQFFAVVFCIYWLLGKYKNLQNILLLTASYTFYGYWNWHFCFLLLFSSSFGFLIGWVLESIERTSYRKLILTFSILVHLGILGYFKYYNFFANTVNSLASGSGIHLPIKDIILPLAISFFTFHIIGYTIDIYRRSYVASMDYINFITHIAFFPQLVAGPIERAGHLLPQFRHKRKFTQEGMISGLRQALWGFFKKLAIADTLALQVNYIFVNHQSLSGSTVALGVLMFCFQIYCDFSGYTDIALGVGRMLGIELLTNFKYPYFARSISDFWHRWHISLSTWFKDYVFIPLGGSRVSTSRKYFNLMVVFLVSGLWHGANWTFAIWGALHGTYMLAEDLLTKAIKIPDNSLIRFLKALLTFALVTLAWVFFRATDFTQAWEIISAIFSKGIFMMPSIQRNGITGLALGLLMLAVEWLQRKRAFGLDVKNMHYTIRWTAYVVLVIIIFSSDNLNKQNEFIYFQF